MSINSEFVILAFGVLCICWVMSILIKKCPTCDSNKMNVTPICETETYGLKKMETIFPGSPEVCEIHASLNQNIDGRKIVS